MRPIREYLDILFRRVQPEVLISNLRTEGFSREELCLRMDSQHIDARSFRHYSHLNLRNYSPDEIDNFCYDMKEYMQGRNSALRESVFNIIPQYMKNILIIQNDMPCCKYLEMLNWRSISLRLGQNLLVMSYLAYEDCKNKRTRDFFAWNSIIGTDNVRLHHMLENGLAENHYHLYGSTQSFPLSWGCLMNHPDKISIFFNTENVGQRMMENLNDNITLGVLDNQLDWVKRLYIACWIRQKLFQRCKTGKKESIKSGLLDFIDFPDLNDLENSVNALRYTYGRVLDQTGVHNAVCLDYAIEYYGNDWKELEYNRFLTGERKFLYDCFYRCYSGDFNKEEQDVFYVYLLIKAQFRSELIQVNQRTGFRNFADYQDRKSDFWWDIKEYIYEAHRLAIQAPLKGEPVTSLEARITPAATYKENIKRVFEIDEQFYFMEANTKWSKEAIQEFGRQQDYFFVIHFIKEKLEYYEKRNNGFIVQPRNWSTRKRAQECAKAMMRVLMSDSYYADRVCGIDACSAEIGCRPETFATEFRFLRNIFGKNTDDIWNDRIKDKRLWITYHVGEDFLDIADGLRAIDETLLFLELERGDRLGHAIALGVDPRLHYSLKRKLLSMPKQDLLDNYVWLLFRSLELGVSIAGDLRSWMQCEAQKLLYYIYPDEAQKTFTLRDYYESWKLRGDYPELYRTGHFCDIDDTWYDQYEYKKKCSLSNLEIIRKQKKITHLYYRYHFGYDEKARGQEIQLAAVTDEYIDLILNMQTSLQMIVQEKGIGIECNPTSNVLIGTFKRYERHPILRFNNYALKNEDNTNSSIQMSASINTDDQGVFDTSLENEFALMACALEEKKDELGKKVYSQDAIYDYLNHVRQMGLDQVFRIKGQ